MCEAEKCSELPQHDTYFPTFAHCDEVQRLLKHLEKRRYIDEVEGRISSSFMHPGSSRMSYKQQNDVLVSMMESHVHPTLG